MKRQAFTLAEVLITLGIIGVVAAMTIPTLISNTNGAQFKSAYKKALSTLNQATIMNIALDDYDLSSIRNPEQLVAVDGDTTAYKIGSKKSMAYLLKNRLQSVSELEYTAEDAVTVSEDSASPLYGHGPGDISTDFFSFSFADGTSFSYSVYADKCVNEDSPYCIGFIDVNGKTGPNIEVECTNNPGKVTAPDEDTACEVEASGVTDIYPVRFYGQTVVPATDAARAVLYNK